MKELSKNYCTHVYGIARDKKHNGLLLTEDFLINKGERPGGADYTTSAQTWLKDNNADIFPFCPVCGKKIKADYFKNILECADNTKPDHVRKWEQITAEHNERVLHPEKWADVMPE